MRTEVDPRHRQGARSWIRWSGRRGGSYLGAMLVLSVCWMRGQWREDLQSSSRPLSTILSILSFSFIRYPDENSVGESLLLEGVGVFLLLFPGDVLLLLLSGGVGDPLLLEGVGSLFLLRPLTDILLLFLGGVGSLLLLLYCLYCRPLWGRFPVSGLGAAGCEIGL